MAELARFTTWLYSDIASRHFLPRKYEWATYKHLKRRKTVESAQERCKADSLRPLLRLVLLHFIYSLYVIHFIAKSWHSEGWTRMWMVMNVKKLYFIPNPFSFFCNKAFTASNRSEQKGIRFLFFSIIPYQADSDMHVEITWKLLSGK